MMNKQVLKSEKDVSGSHNFKLITASIEHSNWGYTKVQRQVPRTSC